MKAKVKFGNPDIYNLPLIRLYADYFNGMFTLTKEIGTNVQQRKVTFEHAMAKGLINLDVADSFFNVKSDEKEQ